MIGTSLCGERRLCWLTELFRLQLPKPSSFLTLCFVWEVSVLNKSKHGKARSKGFWKRYLKDMDRIDGEPMEFDCKIYTGFNAWGFLAEIQKMMTESKYEPEQFQGRTSSCQCTMTLIFSKPGNKENCVANALRVTEYAARGHRSFLGPGSEKKWYGTHVKRTSCISCHQRLRKRRIEKQRKKE